MLFETGPEVIAKLWVESFVRAAGLFLMES
jgi:hypothetical protein